MRAAATLLVACMLLAGCEGPKLPKSWRLTYARVLGVRAEVIGDEARATPEPGERVRMRVLIVGDEPIDFLSYDLVACPATPPRGELASCSGEPFFADGGELPGSSERTRELVFELDVPAEAALDGAERVLIGGTICTDGAAESVEGGVGRCANGDAEPVTFTAHVAIALDEDGVNRNPVLADDAVRFDEEVWAPRSIGGVGSDEDAGAGEEPDAGAPLSVRADGEEHEIAISLEDSARERDDAGPEELMLSHYVTAGVLERRFSFLERGQEPGEPILVKWHMPRVDDPPSKVLLVLVLRDQRGGVAYTLRELAIE